MDIAFSDVLPRAPGLAGEVRKLSGFRRLYVGSVSALARRDGLEARVDEAKLTRLFLDWYEDFSPQRGAAARDRRDFILFSAGLMLAHLVRGQPIAVRPLAGTQALAALPEDLSRIFAFWPEGFVQASWCLGMLETVLAQENEAPLQLDPSFRDLRTWWSFRENACENPLAAVGFLDRFAGTTPNWAMPGAARARPALRQAPPCLAAGTA